MTLSSDNRPGTPGNDGNSAGNRPTSATATDAMSAASTTVTSSASAPGNPASAEALVHQFHDDTIAAERAAAATVEFHWQKPALIAAVVLLLVTLALPHSGSIKGLDVLFYTSSARTAGITWIERFYTWIAVLGGVLLPIGTLVSRSMLIAWLNWFFSGIGTLLALMAIWMRQSHSPNDAASGPSFGLLLATLVMAGVVATMSTLVFRRTAFQRDVEQLRRQQANKDDASRLAQHRLRTGLDQAEQYVEPVDDRRARAKQRARAAAERTQNQR